MTYMQNDNLSVTYDKSSMTSQQWKVKSDNSRMKHTRVVYKMRTKMTYHDWLVEIDMSGVACQ